MKVFEKIDSLKAIYANDSLVRKNGTILLAPGTIPKAKHILYKPLTQELIDEYLIAEYKNEFPEQYIEFLKYSNGAQLYMNRLGINAKRRKRVEQIYIACLGLDINGLPRTPPFGRAKDMEEPFDLRIEDLRRHNDVPNTWLKVGRYAKNETGSDVFGKEYDIFIDCVTQETYGCLVDHFVLDQKWPSLDDCLCAVMDMVSEYNSEYRMP